MIQLTEEQVQGLIQTLSNQPQGLEVSIAIMFLQSLLEGDT